MPDSTVQQVGGDFTTLNAGLADAGTGAGDTITIQGPWTVDDTAVCTVADDNITTQIVAGNVSYHNGLYDESNQHYRLVCASSGSHCIQVNNTGCTIDGLVIVQASIGTSDESIRHAVSGGTTTIKRCILTAAGDIEDQDGIFIGSINGTIDVENCIVYRWGRAGIHSQNSTDFTTHTYNINSCSIFDCTTFTAGSEEDGGGIVVKNNAIGTTNTVHNINVFHTIVQQGNVDGPSADYNELGSQGTVNWGISHSIDSDNSIASRDVGGTGNLPNRTPTADGSPGVGDFVIWINITDDTQDLHLQDNPIDNDAQDADSTLSAEGLTLPILDIDDEIRDRASNKIDIGADAFPPIQDIIVLPEYGQIIFQPIGPEYAQPLSETGDTFPQYGQIIKVNPRPLYAQMFLKEADDDQYGQRIVRD